MYLLNCRNPVIPRQQCRSLSTAAYDGSGYLRRVGTMTDHVNGQSENPNREATLLMYYSPLPLHLILTQFNLYLGTYYLHHGMKTMQQTQQ